MDFLSCLVYSEASGIWLGHFHASLMIGKNQRSFTAGYGQYSEFNLAIPSLSCSVLVNNSQQSPNQICLWGKSRKLWRSFTISPGPQRLWTGQLDHPAKFMVTIWEHWGGRRREWPWLRRTGKGGRSSRLRLFPAPQLSPHPDPFAVARPPVWLWAMLGSSQY